MQALLIPQLLKDSASVSMTPHGGDIFVSAPTGSGKTLSYVIPIIEVDLTYLRSCPCRIKSISIVVTNAGSPSTSGVGDSS